MDAPRLAQGDFAQAVQTHGRVADQSHQTMGGKARLVPEAFRVEPDRR